MTGKERRRETRDESTRGNEDAHVSKSSEDNYPHAEPKEQEDLTIPSPAEQAALREAQESPDSLADSPYPIVRLLDSLAKARNGEHVYPDPATGSPSE